MKYADLQSYYLCGIGSNGNVDHFEVGRYDEESGAFYFKNGSYNETRLFRNSEEQFSVYVVTAVCLQILDNNELLYMYQ